MTQNAVNDGNVIVGSISLAATGADSATARNASAEEVIMITESAQAPGNAHSVGWDAPSRPRSAFLLDRFSAGCTITHCTNGAILDPETCVNQGFFRYVAQRHEEEVREFIAELKRPGIGAGHGIFAYRDFTMCTNGRDLRSSSRNGTPPTQDEVSVSVVGSATSDGLILIVRRND
ncbi:hypothetical protein FRC07_000883 [Ceratobasidium sp. 392]|nr:hypothetical protein FRC07_000883 [Ceratobasidium sp. 392]